MRTTIRPARIHDVPEIIDLERSVATAAHWTREQYESRLKDGCFLVAEAEGRVSAFVCSCVLASEWQIENIIVGERFRRRGLASALLSALIETAERNGSSALHLEVRESNLAARQLYMKQGFLPVGTRPNYYRDPPEDAILYSRSTSTKP